MEHSIDTCLLLLRLQLLQIAAAADDDFLC